jgi:hypothetical protein
MGSVFAAWKADPLNECTEFRVDVGDVCLNIDSLFRRVGRIATSEISFVMSVRPPAWNNSAPTGRIFMKFDIWVFCENMSWRFKFPENLTRITGSLLEDVCTFIISRWILLRMRYVSEKSCRGSQNTHFVFNNFFWKLCRLWGDVEIYGRTGQATDDNIIGLMRIACWVTTATDTHSEYVMLIAFPRQQWLHDPLTRHKQSSTVYPPTRSFSVVVRSTLRQGFLNAKSQELPDE